MNLISRYKIDRDENHAYSVEHDGKTHVLPGTTGILDIVGSRERQNALMGWAKKQALLKVAEHIRAFSGKELTVDEAWIEAVRKSAWKRDKEKLKEAGDLGTAVHAAIDEYIAGRKPKLDDTTRPGFENFMEWKNKAGITIIRGDTYIANLRLGYGGAMDALGEIDGDLVLLDWKTANYLHDENSLQAAAYSLAFEDTFCRTISRAFVVRFGKEKPGDVEEREVSLPAAIPAFCAALELHRAMSAPVWEAK